jgi:transposase
VRKAEKVVRWWCLGTNDRSSRRDVGVHPEEVRRVVLRFERGQTRPLPVCIGNPEARRARRRARQRPARAVVRDRRIKTILDEVAAPLIAVHGVGYDTAGQLLVTAGDNPERLRHERSYAALCGSSPVPVSSGKTDRHRLNRGGDRHANSALWRIVIVRMTSHQPTKDYIARRTAQGRTKQEIIRCLKRYIARELFPHINNVITPTAHEPAPTAPEIAA